MPKSNKSLNQSLMDSLISELINAGDENSMFEICLSGNRKAIASISLRYRLITLGLCNGYSPEQLNQKLAENGCPILYARNIREAVILYALRHHLTVKEWRELDESCRSIRKEIFDREDALSASSLSLSSIREYVLDNSGNGSGAPVTQHKTMLLEKELSKLDNNNEQFRAFLRSNLASFSTVREKVRYYFCKYLLYFLEKRRDDYLAAISYRSGKGTTNSPSVNNTSLSEEDALENLSVIRVRTKLERKHYPPEDARELIDSAPLSLGSIYSAFHQFYFEYTTLDWLHVQLEYYGDPESLDIEQKESLAAAIRKNNRSMQYLSDEAIISWQMEKLEQEEAKADLYYSEENKKAAYQAGRSGENFLRKILRGDLDLDRTTFIAFLLFFGLEANLSGSQKISEERLSEVLLECGFPDLDDSLSADVFFIGFMDAEDPMEFLMDEVETLAFSEENFYLYKTYLASMSYNGKWDELMN